MARVAAGPASEERREQIMEAALRVFAQKGYDGSTTKDIAAAAGVTPGLIYHYFADKRALLGAIFVEHSPVGGPAAVRALLEGMHDLDPRAVLPLVVSGMLGRLEGTDNAPALRLLMGEAMHDPEMRDLFNAGVARTVEALAAYISAQMEAGRLRRMDPVLVAQLVLGSVISCAMRRSCMSDSGLGAYSREQIAATIVEMVLSGLEPRAALPGEARP